MCLVVEANVPSGLDIDPTDGNLVVSAAGESAKLSLRRRWIPEHPVPMVFGQSAGCVRRTVLLIDPVDGNRFRVRQCRAQSPPRWAYAVFAAVATLAAVTLNAVAVATAAITLFAMLLPLLCPRSCSRLMERYWLMRCSPRSVD